MARTLEQQVYVDQVIEVVPVERIVLLQPMVRAVAFDKEKLRFERSKK